jgi:hypothetical protein
MTSATARRSSSRATGHRDETLAIGLLAQRATVLMRDAHRVLSLLRDCGVVDDQVRVVAAHDRVGLVEQHLLDWLGRPARHRDEVMHLLDLPRCDSRNERRDALSLPRGHESPQVHRSPLAPHLVSKRVEKWLKPTIELLLSAVAHLLRGFHARL